MSRHYSPRAFMIEAPNRLLEQYYEGEGLGGDISWRHLSERDINLVFEAYQKAPEKIRRKMDEDFRSIHNLADEGGIKTLIEVGRSPFHQVDFVSLFEGTEGHLERAFIAFLNRPQAFEAGCKGDLRPA